MSYQIREVERGDLDQLVALCAAHAAYEQCDYVPQGKREALEVSLFGEQPLLQVLVVVEGKRLLGYVTFVKQFSTWDAAHYLYMDCLFLLEESRGLGIGRALLGEVMEAASKLGCSEIQWQTPVSNKRAIAFYTRAGACEKKKSRFFLPVRWVFPGHDS